MKNKIYCVSKTINHRNQKGGNGLDWSKSMCKQFTDKKEAEEFYKDIVSKFDFNLYTNEEYKFNICLYEPIISRNGKMLGFIGKILKNKSHEGSYFT
jgi:hypothetical protein